MQPKNVVAFSRKYAKVILLILVLFAFGIDLGRFKFSGKGIDLEGGQTQSWWEIAHNLETGAGYKACNDYYVPNCGLTEQFTAMREPLPVLTFALVGRLSHDSVTALAFVPILMYFLTFLGIYLLGENLGSVETGLLSLLLWTFYLPQERVEASLTGDLFASAFIIFGLVLFVQVIKTNQLKKWLGFGVLMGLAVLSRSAALIIALVLVGGYVVFFREKAVPFWDTVWKATLSLAVLGLTISPWVIRNALVFGEPVIGTSLIGFNLYRHNAIVATDTAPHYVGPDESYAQVQALVTAHPEMMTPLNEVQIDKIYRDEAVRLIRENPLSYARLVVYRILPLWFNIGVVEQYGKQQTIFDYLSIVEQAVLLLLFLVGLKYGDRIFYLFSLTVLVYSASYLAIGSQLRYLIPVMPIIIIIGSFGVIKMWFAYHEFKSVNNNV